MAKQRRIDPLQVLIEVVVITIGIVLAYQLNAMREVNKTKEAEFKALQEIKSNLELDLIDLTVNQTAHENALVLIDSLEQWDGPYEDQIGMMLFQIFRDYLFLPQTSAFETLKAKGVDLITNDSIRIKTQRLYDFYYQILIKYESEYEANQLYDDFEWVVTTYYKSFPVRDLNADPIPKVRSSAWLKDDEVTTRLDLCKFEHQYSLAAYQKVKVEINNLIASIDKELKSR
ncbi:DUF6090 family protein [Ekhidna sp.]|uniref:DUF6090 family protein n=1 Tax=Ekhidna sp. TaxID=2608089 RepID=UPI00351764FA